MASGAGMSASDRANVISLSTQKNDMIGLTCDGLDLTPFTDTLMHEETHFFKSHIHAHLR